MLFCKSVQRLDADVQLCWSVEFCKIGHEDLRLLKLLAQWLEVDDLRHFDLCIETSSLVQSLEVGNIADAECIGTLDGNFYGSRIVDSAHALNLLECDKISVLKTMPCLVENGDHTFLVDPCYDAACWVLARRIATSEVGAKIREDGAEQAKCVGYDQVNAILVAEIRDYQLILQRGIRKHHDFVLLQLREVGGEVGGRMLSDRRVRIQLGNARHSDLCAGFAHVFWVQEELRGQVGDGGRLGVVEGE